MANKRCCDLMHDLFLPTLLFTAMGGMTWAVRGCSGYGASSGCIFAGVMWGAGWWYLAHESRGPQTRRYCSAWIIPAVTLAFGYSGARGWMQWHFLFEGHLSTNPAKGEYAPISTFYGFLWMFIAGMPWAGLGACLLAWCGSLRETHACHWVLRMVCGVGGAYLGRYLFEAYPEYFLPLYSSIEAQYKDLDANPSLRRMINDNRQAMFHMGYYVGFLLFECLRKDWKNVVLILTVGILNGLGWALFQTWKWAPGIWKDANFNWWRCWESSGGLSIGFAFGIAYFLVNRRMSDDEMSTVAKRRSLAGPNFEWLVVFGGLASYLGMFLQSQTEGWSTYCLAILEIFAVIYYLANRRNSLNSSDLSPRSLWTEVCTKPEWGAVAIGIANTLILFLPRILGRRTAMQYGVFPVAAVSVAGLIWYWMNHARFDEERRLATPDQGDPNLERMGLYLGLLFGLGHSARSGLKGWFNIYLGNEDYWSRVLWNIMGPLFVLGVLAIVVCILFRPLPTKFQGVLFPHSYAAIWLVLIVQNVLGLLVTGPLSNWVEMQFAIYYVQLFLITAVIVVHYKLVKQTACERLGEETNNSGQ
jgi:hypothetical protein